MTAGVARWFLLLVAVAWLGGCPGWAEEAPTLESAVAEALARSAELSSLQAQMEGARVIEDVHFPDEVVTAGTEVSVRDLTDHTERTYWILGYGDSVQDSHVINYRAPLGQGLVGKRAGDIAELDANGSIQRLEVVGIRRRLP